MLAAIAGKEVQFNAVSVLVRKSEEEVHLAVRFPFVKVQNSRSGQTILIGPKRRNFRNSKSDHRRSEVISIKRLVNEHDDSNRDQTLDGSDTDCHITSDNEFEIEHGLKVRSEIRTEKFTDNDTRSEKRTYRRVKRESLHWHKTFCRAGNRESRQ